MKKLQYKKLIVPAAILGGGGLLFLLYRQSGGQPVEAALTDEFYAPSRPARASDPIGGIDSNAALPYEVGVYLPPNLQKGTTVKTGTTSSPLVVGTDLLPSNFAKTGYVVARPMLDTGIKPSSTGNKKPIKQLPSTVSNK